MVDTAVSCSVFVKKPAINTLNGRREDSNEQRGVNVVCGRLRVGKSKKMPNDESMTKLE